MPRKKREAVELRLRNFNIPASLKNLQESLQNSGKYAILAKPTHYDKTCYLLDLLFNNPIYDRSATAKSYKALNSRILASLFGCPYDRQIINFLLDHDIIECDGKYQVNVESKGYRLKEEYMNERAVCVYNQDSKFVLKLAEKNWQRMNDTERFLWQQVGKVTIRYEDALTYMFYSNDLIYTLSTIKPYLNPEHDWGFDQVMHAIEDLDDSIRNTVKTKFISLHKIQTGQFFFTRDGVGQRVHTNITNLWSEFRQFLSLDGCADLVNIDLKNSQLLFSCLSIRHYYRERQQPMPPDVRRWMAMCQSGKAYEQLHQVIYGRPLDQRQRRWFKDKFFATILYCEVKVMANSKEGKAFRKEFPNVFEFIAHMKAKNYRNFPIQMQLLESQLVIRQLAHWLYQKLIPVLTIHDSVLVRAEDALTIENKFKQLIKDLKITAQIKVEHMTTASERIYQQQQEQLKMVDDAEFKAEMKTRFEASMVATRDALNKLRADVAKHPELLERTLYKAPVKPMDDISKAFDDFLAEAAKW
jgi:hypothetical protein